jgi:hypothetical protein
MILRRRTGARSSDPAQHTGKVLSPLSPLPPALLLVFFVEFLHILAYDNDADEFVRLSCRGFAGWRRDEWAQSPLFIWGKSSGFLRDFLAG